MDVTAAIWEVVADDLIEVAKVDELHFFLDTTDESVLKAGEIGTEASAVDRITELRAFAEVEAP